MIENNGEESIIVEENNIEESINVVYEGLSIEESDPIYTADKPSLLEAINAKVDKIEGKQLSTEDYTTEEKRN